MTRVFGGAGRAEGPGSAAAEAVTGADRARSPRHRRSQPGDGVRALRPRGRQRAGSTADISNRAAGAYNAGDPSGATTLWQTEGNTALDGLNAKDSGDAPAAPGDAHPLAAVAGGDMTEIETAAPAVRSPVRWWQIVVLVVGVAIFAGAVVFMTNATSQDQDRAASSRRRAVHAARRCQVSDSSNAAPVSTTSTPRARTCGSRWRRSYASADRMMALDSQPGSRRVGDDAAPGCRSRRLARRHQHVPSTVSSTTCRPSTTPSATCSRSSASGSSDSATTEAQNVSVRR